VSRGCRPCCRLAIDAKVACTVLNRPQPPAIHPPPEPPDLCPAGQTSPRHPIRSYRPAALLSPKRAPHAPPPCPLPSRPRPAACPRRSASAASATSACAAGSSSRRRRRTTLWRRWWVAQPLSSRGARLLGLCTHGTTMTVPFPPAPPRTRAAAPPPLHTHTHTNTHTPHAHTHTALCCRPPTHPPTAGGARGRARSALLLCQVGRIRGRPSARRLALPRRDGQRGWPRFLPGSCLSWRARLVCACVCHGRVSIVSKPGTGGGRWGAVGPSKAVLYTAVVRGPSLPSLLRCLRAPPPTHTHCSFPVRRRSAARCCRRGSRRGGRRGRPPAAACSRRRGCGDGVRASGCCDGGDRSLGTSALVSGAAMWLWRAPAVCVDENSPSNSACFSGLSGVAVTALVCLVSHF
jgi:hypothetical protein